MGRLYPFAPLYDICNAGSNASKYGALADFPKIIDVELTSACNFRCKMCPTGNLSLTRPAGFMDMSLVTEIAKQCEPHGTAVRFIGWGEPLLHEFVAESVFRFTQRRLLSHINTNGSKLTPHMAQWLINAGLSSLKFSFQGVDRKSYEEMRGTDYFDGLLETAAMVKELRGTRPYPYLHISTSITDESSETVAAFRERAAQCADSVTIGHTTFDYMNWKAARLRPHEIEVLKRLAGAQTVEKRHPTPCTEIFDKLSIHFDGSVRVCCNDHSGETNLGNVNDAPLADIWRHHQIEAYRKTLAAGRYEGPLCSVCYDYSDLTIPEG